MADYLVYWKSYWKDIVEPAGITPDWSSNSRAFYTRVKKGDRLWVLVSGGESSPQEWRLLHCILVERRSLKATKWGRYRLLGTRASSALYKLEPQPDFAAIMRLLSFAGGHRIKVKGKAIGKALQTRGFRPLSEKDADLLLAYSSTLPRLASR